MYKKTFKQFRKITASLIAVVFASNLLLTPATSSAQAFSDLPAPGIMLSTTAAFSPALIKGLTVHPENPLLFDFIVDSGQKQLQDEALKEESNKLIKYFLAALTVPEDQMWVNLSPHEKDRIVPEALGVTEMGRDMLAQDYILKQITSSLMFPENELGKMFWEKIYSQIRNAEIPVESFNKVWIVPDKAVVYEHKTSAFVVESHLKVMLTDDYENQRRSLAKGGLDEDYFKKSNPSEVKTTDVIRNTIIPVLEKEVNEGENFVSLRQIYQSMILAAWYKKRLKESLLGQVYIDQNKTKGIDLADKEMKQKIYNQYLEAFKKGVYNFVKEEYDPASQQVIPRKYFSGGLTMRTPLDIQMDMAMLPPSQKDTLPE